MFLIDVCPEHFDQSGIINPKRLSVWSLNIDHQLFEIGRERIRVFALCLGQIDRAGGFVRKSEARTILQQLSLLASCQVWESLVIRRASEGKEAIAIDSRITRKSFIQLFAAHALNRVTPEAVNFSDDVH